MGTEHNFSTFNTAREDHPIARKLGGVHHKISAPLLDTCAMWYSNKESIVGGHSLAIQIHNNMQQTYPGVFEPVNKLLCDLVNNPLLVSSCAWFLTGYLMLYPPLDVVASQWGWMTFTCRKEKINIISPWGNKRAFPLHWFFFPCFIKWKSLERFAGKLSAFLRHEQAFQPYRRLEQRIKESSTTPHSPELAAQIQLMIRNSKQWSCPIPVHITTSEGVSAQDSYFTSTARLI